jgi:hypothetical protein
MPKRATQVKLSERKHNELEQLTKRHRSELQQVVRARIVLSAAQGNFNVQIARALAKSAGYGSLVAGSLGGTTKN